MGYLPLVFMFALFLLGTPVAISLVASVLSYFVFINHTVPIPLILQRMVASVESSSLWAVPFFITAGCVLNYSGVTNRLMSLAEGLVGHRRGALAHVNVLLSALMGGISGSASADAASDCKILVPQMVKHGYSVEFSAAVTAASAMITPIIPPGTGLILFAFVANVSVGRMFLAGYVPGIILTIGMMFLVSVLAKKNGYMPSREKRASGAELFKLFKRAIWALLLPFVIIMSIRTGMVTPTECGAITIFYALFVGAFVYKELKPKHIWPILKEAFLGTAAVLIILSAANAFSWYLSYERIPQQLTSLMTTLNFSKFGFLMAVNLLFLVLGLFMEGGASIIILVPLLMKTAMDLGIDPIHFGLIICFNTQIGAITPPFGVVLFLICPLLKISMSKMAKALIPFFILLVACLLLFTFVPALSTWLPSLVYD